MINDLRPDSWNSFTINITSGTSSTSNTSGTSSNLSLYTGNLPSLYTGNLLSNNAVIQDLTQQVSDTQKLLLQQKETINTMTTTLNAPSQKAFNEINQQLNCMAYTLNIPSKANIGRIDNTIKDQQIRIRSQDNQIKKLARSLDQQIRIRSQDNQIKKLSRSLDQQTSSIDTIQQRMNIKTDN